MKQKNINIQIMESEAILQPWVWFSGGMFHPNDILNSY